MMNYFAHSENDKQEKHQLSKHLIESSNLMESFACHEEYKPIFKVTGLLHDLGKYQGAFQSYLENGGRRGSVPHASWGAGYASKFKIHEASIAIDGHHKGIPDKTAWKSDINPFVYNDVAEFDEVINSFLADVGIAESNIKPQNPIAFEDGYQREIFIRYLFSALTDGDWLSTEEHFVPEKTAMRIRRELPIEMMIDKLEMELSGKSKDGEINQLRNKAREETVSKALMPPGFYSLALPTGMGKTLTSLAWALRHAKQNDLKRIIIVLPYISIIDQTAKELKKIFGEEWVLEHHSSYNEGQKDGEDKNENYTPEQKRKQLACENWDYPIIITTTVQFSNRCSATSPPNAAKSTALRNQLLSSTKYRQSQRRSFCRPCACSTTCRPSCWHRFCSAPPPNRPMRNGLDSTELISYQR